MCRSARAVLTQHPLIVVLGLGLGLLGLGVTLHAEGPAGAAPAAASASASTAASAPASASASAPASASGASTSARAAAAVAVDRYHYVMNARVRPLLLFWINASNVGDAVVTRRQVNDEADYSLLIGSDPARAPRKINRWGYIEESVRGSGARLVGLMSRSDEESLKEAEANVGKEGSGSHTFRTIQATIDGGQARSVVTSVSAPVDYTFWQVGTVLDLARRESTQGQARVIPLPAGTRPGLLSALAEIMHTHVEQAHASGAGAGAGDGASANAAAGAVTVGAPMKYVYHGKLYELRATRVRTIPSFRNGTRVYGRAIATDFEIKNLASSEVTPFSMTYGADGAFSAIPLAMSYRPRWWMQVDLVLDDSTPGPSAPELSLP